MADSSLIFRLFARDETGPGFTSAAAHAEETSKKISGFAKAVGAFAAIDIGVHAVKAAGDFQFQMNRLVHAAGETQANIKMVGAGIQQIMMDTGTSMEDATKGAYTVESAGYHGADALKVLQVAAQGAKIENADLGNVTNAVSSAMVDYHVKASDAASVMNTLIAGVAHGKTTMDGMATAFSNVGAAGATAHIPMADLAAAIATMTMHGTDAAKAGTYLRQVIGQLEGPSAKARDEMKGLGLDSNKVALTLSSGPGGLAKAIGMIDTAITTHLTPAGLVAVQAFKKSGGATKDWQKLLANLPPTMQTTFGALANMTGGVKSLQGFLQLGGENLKTFKANTDAINASVKRGGKSVDGWKDTQKTFNVQLDKFKQTIGVAGLKLGQVLLPAVQNILSPLSSMATFMSNNSSVIVPIVGVIVGLAGAIWAVNKASAAWSATLKAGEAIRALFAAEVAGGTILEWAQVAATVALDVATTILDTALAVLTSPITIIIALIAGIVIGIIELWKHCQTFRDVVKDVFHFFLDLITGTFNWIKDHWHLLLAIFLGPFGLLIDAITVHWQWIKDHVKMLIGWIDKEWHNLVRILRGPFEDVVNFAKMVWGWIKAGVMGEVHAIEKVWHAIIDVLRGPFKTAWAWIKSGWDTFTGTIRTIVDTVTRVFSAIEGAIKAPFINAFDAIKSVYDSTIGPIVSAVSKVGGVVGKAGGAISSFFGFRAAGGPVAANMPYIVGEQGPELFVPDGSGTVISNDQTMAMGRQMVASGGGSAQRVEVVLHFDGSGDLVELIRKSVRVRGGSVQRVLGTGAA